MKRVDARRALRTERNAAAKLERRNLFPSEPTSPGSEGEDLDDPDDPDDLDIESEDDDPSADYGRNCRKPDMPQDQLIAAIKKLVETLKVDRKTRDLIVEQTKAQKKCDQWWAERRYRLTASDYARICKMRPSTLPGRTVKSILYKVEFKSAATDWGNDHEDEALKKFEDVFGKQTKKCGVFIDLERPYLAASPDALVIGEKAVVEIKCPYSARAMTILEAAEKKRDFCLQRDPATGTVALKRNHDYFYQVQGQLAITEATHCYFVVWTLVDVHIEVIEFEQTFWEAMVAKLDPFFHNHVAPEIVDPRLCRSMPIRSSHEEAAMLQKRTERQERAAAKKAAETETQAIRTAEEDLGVYPLEDSIVEQDYQALPVELDQLNTKSVFLVNGNQLSPILHDNKRIMLKNTCALDSLVSVMAVALQENKTYREMASMYRTANQVINLAFLALDRDIDRYAARAQVLIVNKVARMESSSADCFCFIDDVAALCETAPSAVRKTTCLSQKCYEEEENLAFIRPAIHSLKHLEGGQVELLISDELREKVEQMCPACNVQLQFTYFKTDLHLLLTVDEFKRGAHCIRELEPSFKGTFRIKNLDVTIEVDKKRYVLSGVIEYVPIRSHFVAYARRQNGQWELHDDTKAFIKTNPSLDQDIEPHLIMYTIQ
nr:PREDICTED: uncharacterized protein LOC109034621 [Bemisia tabaci]